MKILGEDQIIKMENQPPKAKVEIAMTQTPMKHFKIKLTIQRNCRKHLEQRRNTTDFKESRKLRQNDIQLLLREIQCSQTKMEINISTFLECILAKNKLR